MEINIPADLLYTREHEWVAMESDDVAVIGITDYAQDQLEDIVFIELPEVGSEVKANDAFGTIEAVKAVEDFFAPVSGEVVDANNKLEDNPELCNQDPYSEGWIAKIKISDKTELDSLISAEEYRTLIQ
ncbi:glycine cleavage system protein GcvH [candidate division KSB1 bacterium]